MSVNSVILLLISDFGANLVILSGISTLVKFGFVFINVLSKYVYSFSLAVFIAHLVLYNPESLIETDASSFKIRYSKLDGAGVDEKLKLTFFALIEILFKFEHCVKLLLNETALSPTLISTDVKFGQFLNVVDKLIPDVLELTTNSCKLV